MSTLEKPEPGTGWLYQHPNFGLFVWYEGSAYFLPSPLQYQTIINYLLETGVSAGSYMVQSVMEVLVTRVQRRFVVDECTRVSCQCTVTDSGSIIVAYRCGKWALSLSSADTRDLITTLLRRSMPPATLKYEPLEQWLEEFARSGGIRRLATAA